MNLEFSLTELNNLLEVIKKETEKFSESIDILDTNILSLEEKIKTNETKIYEEILNKYNERKEKLFLGKSELNKLCNTLEEKILELEEKTNNIKNSIE